MAGVGWNPADVSAQVVLSDNNRLAAWAGAGDKGGRCIAHKASGDGKFYFELQDVVIVNNDSGIGLASEELGLGNYSPAVFALGYGSMLSTNPTGKTLGVAVDCDSDATYFRCWLRYDNGVWTSAGSSAVTGPSDPSSGNGFYKPTNEWVAPAFRIRVATEQVRVVTAASDFLFAMPAGYSEWAAGESSFIKPPLIAWS